MEKVWHVITGRGGEGELQKLHGEQRRNAHIHLLEESFSLF